MTNLFGRAAVDTVVLAAGTGRAGFSRKLASVAGWLCILSILLLVGMYWNRPTHPMSQDETLVLFIWTGVAGMGAFWTFVAWFFLRIVAWLKS
jgi:hypothetical protein